MDNLLQNNLQLVAEEWLNKVSELIDKGDSDMLGEYVVPLMLPLTLVKMDWDADGGKEWDLLKACQFLGEEIISSFDSTKEENEDKPKPVKKAAKKAAKKATKRTAKEGNKND